MVFVKVNYKVKGIGNNVRCDARINYVNVTDASKYGIGGGFCNKDACSLVFKADNLEDAKNIMNANPILKRWKNRYNDIKWDLTVIPCTLSI